MAPEQLADDPTDARTDIYALGVLLFEMATGRRPFIKERREALMFEIFSNAPPTVRSLRPEVPVAVDQLIDACLRKEPSERPGSAAQVAEVLRAVAGGTSSGATAAMREVVRGIVVLPLRNVSGDPAQEYFADGMTDAIISDFSASRRCASSPALPPCGTGIHALASPDRPRAER
jgi:serine/threonine protein kinase